jgi:hypothetical protein
MLFKPWCNYRGKKKTLSSLFIVQTSHDIPDPKQTFLIIVKTDWNSNLHVIIPNVNVHLVLLAGDQELEPFGVVLQLQFRFQKLLRPVQQLSVLVCHAVEHFESFNQKVKKK